jgi:phosphatidylserine/phosphatidylglycerophosphate/cardiolipin synthase-like enzyme
MQKAWLGLFLGAVVACGGGASSATTKSTSPTPGEDGGTPNSSADDGGGSGDEDSGTLADGAPAPHPDGGAATSQDGGSGPGKDGGSTPPTTAGITITVEPDGTGDAAGLLTAIQNAKSAVHVEMYLLSNSTYISALTTLHSKGIDVKVILNETFPSGTATAQTNASSYSTLSALGIAHWAPTTTGFDSYTHEKTVIIDPGTANAQAWIMTMNLDTDAPKYNREYLALDTNTADVTEAEAIFEADYASTDITPTGTLVVAPSPQNDAQSAILALVNSATTSIDVESEEYDSAGIEGAIATALENKAKAGVTVHMVLEDSTDSEQTTAVTALQSAGGKVVGYASSGTGLDIHAKAIVVDGTTAYVGSENLSGGSLGYNRELGVIFNEASEVAKVASTIATDFTNGGTYSSQ